jgi:hypothetical protein
VPQLPPPIPDLSSLPPAAFKIFSRRQSISGVMLQLAATAEDTVTVRNLLDHFGERAFGALLLVFAIPNAFPMPPGVSFVMGLPLLFITSQIMLRRPKLWLPRALTARGLSRETFVSISLKVLPTLRRIEQVLKPRYQSVLSPWGEGALGAMAFLLALIMFLPIPFGNMLPAAALVAFAFGMVEFDGIAVLVGWLLAAASLVVLAVLSKSVIAALTGMLHLMHLI